MLYQQHTDDSSSPDGTEGGTSERLESQQGPSPPPFIGRAAELQLLAERLTDARGGNARTVLIGGDAGIGKSRLLSTFAQQARELGAHVLVGACEAHFGDPMPYGPLLEILEAFGREDGERLGGPAYRRLVDFFGLDGPGLTSPQQVFLAVRQMLEHVGADAPVVLILDDLQWADPSTLELVRHLAQARPEGRRLLMVCSYRSPELERDNPLWQLLAGTTFLRRTERIELPGFTLAELREFLTAVQGGGRVDPRLVERCFDWSDGIPFYAEQLMAAGALNDLDSLQLPADTRSVELARFAELGPDALKVLLVAAVAGRAVSRRLLRRISGLPADALGAAVQECFDRQMLVTGRDEDVYRFRHTLLREAVYQTTVRDTRVDLHLAMAEALTDDPRLSLTEGSATAELASHWYRAGRWPEALAAAVEAGDDARRKLAYGSAQVQYTRALQAWPRTEDPEKIAGVSRVELLVRAAEAARWSGDAEQALAHISQAAAQAGTDRAGELNERRATYLWEVGRRTEAVTAYREAAALLHGQPASAVKARVLAGIALADLHAGRYQEGCAGAAEALQTAITAGARAEEGRALNLSGLALGMLGDPRSVERLERAIAIARAENHVEDLLRAYGNLGLVLEHAGRLREAAETTAEGLAEARQFEVANTIQAMILANNASAAFVLLGDWDKAEKIITEAIQDRSPAATIYPRLTLSEIKVARGAYAQAHGLLDSIADADHGDDPRFLGPLHTARALLALGEGDLRRAGDEVRRGVEAVRDGENRLELLRLCAVGLRCAADQRNATAFGDWLAQAAWTPGEETTPEAAQLVMLCGAERKRMHGRDTAAEWSRVADGWAYLDRPYEVAYARWRQAAAAYAKNEGSDPRQPARAAYQVAAALGAEPLRAEVARLANQIGLDLGDRPAPATFPYGLTHAEFETLRLLCDGLDATAIANARGVAKRTAETQLGRIYRKMDVRSSLEAIAAAHRQNIFGQDTR